MIGPTEMCKSLLAHIALSIAFSAKLPEAYAAYSFNSNLSLIASSMERIDHIDIRTSARTPIILHNTEIVSAIAFDQKHNCLYYLCLFGTIRRQCLNGSYDVETISDISLSIWGTIAYDWASELLYVGIGRNIDVIRPVYNDSGSELGKHMRQTIIKTEYLQSTVHSLVVAPIDGYLFCLLNMHSQQTPHKYQIWRAHLDGSNMQLLFNLGSNWYVRPLSIDLTSKRLYWIETTNHNIRRCDFEGGNYELVSLSHSHRPSTFMFFNDWMYWHDVYSGNIFAANKGECITCNIGLQHGVHVSIHIPLQQTCRLRVSLLVAFHIPYRD